ncbi:hypothetical protein [Clostridium pasteurianum]|uniref:Uncharacterized protein n=1 Tax=Clostridium pasteurianum BC1 TaxID=86416 RepID=R4K4T4_CLOPA|nr:hypothetical protein [Clostridium pasteurianum]AGK97578.1 hypothetical protein Clopa_2734 [Clostridium pasteurianum BC1]
MTQKAQEGKLWQEIEKKKAKKRMLSGGYPTDNGSEGEKWEVRNIIADKVGIGSGRTYECAKVAIDKIDFNDDIM